MSNKTRKTVGILWREDDDEANVEQSRFKHVFEALTHQGLEPRAVLYSDDAVDRVRKQVIELDGVLVWVDPIAGGQDRSLLDPLLREVASRGVWVSAHPDVILQMGTKDVLVKTKVMAWGTECYLYRSRVEMAEQLPNRLSRGPRVLKQHRGNGGNGVWKVELVAEPRSLDRDMVLRVLHAQRGSSSEEMSLDTFLDRCAVYFGGSGCMIDQPYQPRLADGMIRCYVVQDKVAGFGHQFVTALLPPPQGTTQSPLPPPRLYYGPAKPEFQAIKAKLEDEWIPEMQRILDIDTASLPALWDADFLYGPEDESGRDTYVLCEINASSVSPFPHEALEPLALAVASRLGTPF